MRNVPLAHGAAREVVTMTECALRTYGPETCAILAMTGPFDQIPAALGTLYTWLQSEGHVPSGMPLTVYLDDPAEVDPADARWEVRAPIEADAEERAPDERGLGIVHVPATRVASTVHRGPYDQVGAAYERLLGWIAEQGLVVAGPPMEAYLNDPGEASPEDYLTEAMVPVRERG